MPDCRSLWRIEIGRWCILSLRGRCRMSYVPAHAFHADRSGHPVRRLRHPALAGVARSFPKQLWPLTTDRTLLQETALRAHDGARFAAPIVVCNQDHRFLIAEQLRAAGIVSPHILLEPIGRNSAPAIAAAALYRPKPTRTRSCGCSRRITRSPTRRRCTRHWRLPPPRHERPYRDLRHAADRTGDRLWLYRARHGAA